MSKDKQNIVKIIVSFKEVSDWNNRLRKVMEFLLKAKVAQEGPDKKEGENAKTE